jgi:hypothetical protein
VRRDRPRQPLHPAHQARAEHRDDLDRAGEILALVAIEVGGRLVEHERGRFKRQRAAEAHDLLDAEGQGVDGIVAVAERNFQFYS